MAYALKYTCPALVGFGFRISLCLPSSYRRYAHGRWASGGGHRATPRAQGVRQVAARQGHSTEVACAARVAARGSDGGAARMAARGSDGGVRLGWRHWQRTRRGRRSWRRRSTGGGMRRGRKTGCARTSVQNDAHGEGMRPSPGRPCSADSEALQKGPVRTTVADRSGRLILTR